MHTRTARNRAILATAAALLGAGLATGTPAEAVSIKPQQAAVTTTTLHPAAAHAPEAARSGWHLLWGPKTHTATRYWATHDFVPDTRHLAVNFGCWGHDGAKMKADIVRTRDGKVVKRGGYDYCHDAAQRRLDFNSAGPGTSYYMRLYLTGPKHSMWAKAYDYHG
ncbi:hypothetical protein [Streptomyces sp. NPDC005890]|uniref:hypothetical protein n=1 Tax=Streptomyces sp. NPDC005890 TaxID=3154568 RepID=UPI0033EE869D